jgi:hypothetical protein
MKAKEHILKQIHDCKIDWLQSDSGEGEALKTNCQNNDASNSTFHESNVQQGNNNSITVNIYEYSKELNEVVELLKRIIHNYKL